MKNPYYPYEADNRSNLSIDCPIADYKYNFNTYKKLKSIFYIFFVVCTIACAFLICLSNNENIKIISSAILGGNFSLFVWLVTIWHQDKINKEIAQIDICVSIIDKYLEDFEKPVNMINPETAEIKIIDKTNIDYKVIHVFEIITRIINEKEFTFNKTQKFISLKWFDKTDVTIDEYTKKWNNILKTKTIDVDKETTIKITNWNEYIIKKELIETKKHILNYKQYILCGNAPIRDEDLEKYQRKARLFDKLLDKNKRKNVIKKLFKKITKKRLTSK